MKRLVGVAVLAFLFVLLLVSETAILAGPTVLGVEQDALVGKYAYLIKQLNGRVVYEEADEIARAVVKAVEDTGLDGSLLIALMKTESNFKRYAVSSKNYQGLMQTPGHSGYPDIDVLWGARILQEKLRITNQDLPKALALYKGGNNKMARQQAREVLKLWEKVGIVLLKM